MHTETDQSQMGEKLPLSREGRKGGKVLKEIFVIGQMHLISGPRPNKGRKKLYTWASACFLCISGYVGIYSLSRYRQNVPSNGEPGNLGYFRKWFFVVVFVFSNIENQTQALACVKQVVFHSTIHLVLQRYFLVCFLSSQRVGGGWRDGWLSG